MPRKEQPTFADLDYQHKRRRTRQGEFLERMDSLIPWQKKEQGKGLLAFGSPKPCSARRAGLVRLLRPSGDHPEGTGEGGRYSVDHRGVL